MAHRTEHGITFFDFETISEAQAALNDDGVDLEEHEYWDREIQREHEEEDERDTVSFSQDDEGVKWFLNECLDAYPYPEHLQRDHFPNDFHTPYDSEEEAMAAADALPDPNVDCGHCITPEDRCSDISDRNCMGRH